MNPEEGDLRPQLLDRFALCVDIQGIRDPAARMAIMARNLAYEADPESFCAEWAPREHALSEEIARARQLLPAVRYTQSDLATIAAMMSELGVDGHRADLVVLKAARAHAAFEGHTRLSDHDILLAAELALPHRLKRRPRTLIVRPFVRPQSIYPHLVGDSERADECTQGRRTDSAAPQQGGRRDRAVENGGWHPTPRRTAIEDQLYPVSQLLLDLPGSDGAEMPREVCACDRQHSPCIANQRTGQGQVRHAHGHSRARAEHVGHDPGFWQYQCQTAGPVAGDQLAKPGPELGWEHGHTLQLADIG
jgi:hypothetical protein